MIDHKNKLIFIHIPKTAGTSLQELLFNKKIFNAHRKSLKIIKKIGRYNDYYKFAIVRNPFDRLVSIYHYYILGGNGSYKDWKIGKTLSKMGFKKFILNLNNLKCPYYYEIEPMIMKQTEYLLKDGCLAIDHWCPK